MIVFEKVRFQNLFSFGNQPVELDFKKAKRTMICGLSGGGKSVLCIESVTYALYGKAFRKMNKSDVVNTINNGGTLVELTFSIGTKHYKIIRGQKPNIFEIYVDDFLINQNPTVRDYQKYLEENIIGMSYKIWCRVVVLGFANHTPFMTLTANDRRQMVDELLGIEVFQRMNARAAELLTESKGENTLIDRDIESNKNAIKIQKKTFSDLKKQDDIKKEKLEDEIKEIQKDIDCIDEKLEELTGILDDYKKNAPEFVENELKEKLKSLNEYKYRIDQKHKLKGQYLKLITSNAVCPTCKQDINPEFSESIIKTTKKEMDEYTEATNKIEESIGTVNTYLASLKSWNKSVSDVQEEMIEYQRKQKYLKDTIIDRQKVMSTDDNSETMQNIAKTIVELTEKNTDLLKQKEELTERMELLQQCRLLLRDDGIKAKIIKLYLPTLNSLINEYLEKMDFTMRVELDENFNEKIFSRFKDEMSFTQLSEGEKARVNLAMILSWRRLAELRNSVKLNILVLDEVLDSTLSAADVMNVINFFNDSEQNIFIISHKPEIVESYVDDVITVEKKGNFSRIAS